MEKKTLDLDERLNILRAGVLGANDGILSVAGVVIGVAAAGSSNNSILIAGLAAVLAGAFSMAGGEYVSVSTQSDTEKAAVFIQKKKLERNFDEEVKGVANYYVKQGINSKLADEIAQDIMKKKPLEITVQQKYGLEIDDYTNPWQAAISSFVAFTIGSALPLLAIISLPENIKIIGTIITVTLALFLTGFVSAKLGKALTRPAIIRNIVVGLLTMSVTYAIGHILNV
ncbi:MAG: VIT family protein [Streptococcaceae bacterium]|jgi:VIT1/CCC1 family predicted Fe2+/Mn2+ transporter|nr:VIT family protein [Streptococcaceae bacterium]